MKNMHYRSTINSGRIKHYKNKFKLIKTNKSIPYNSSGIKLNKFKSHNNNNTQLNSSIQINSSETDNFPQIPNPKYSNQNINQTYTHTSPSTLKNINLHNKITIEKLNNNTNSGDSNTNTNSTNNSKNNKNIDNNNNNNPQNNTLNAAALTFRPPVRTIPAASPFQNNSLNSYNSMSISNTNTSITNTSITNSIIHSSEEVVEALENILIKG